jgi:hypothetical protein
VSGYRWDASEKGGAFPRLGPSHLHAEIALSAGGC